MTAPVIWSLAPLTLASTTLPTANLKVSPDIAALAYRTAGNEFSSVEAVLGGSPRVSFSCTLAEAYAAIGLKATKFTTCNIYLAKFVDGIRDSSSTHAKYALASSATAYAYIKSISCGHGGIATAEVEIIFLSSDGLIHPLTPTTNNALPSLASQPALRTCGPCTINGTTITGVESFDMDLGSTIEAVTSDGNLYPTVCTYVGGNPVITVQHTDPETLRGTLGFTGAAISANFVQYLRDVNTTTQLASATGMSFTVASGRVIPLDWGADNLQLAKGGFRVNCLSTSATHPVVVATGASVP